MSKHTLWTVAEIAIQYKRAHTFESMPFIRVSEDAYKIFLKIWNTDQLDYIEEIYILLLNRANRVLGVSNVSKGGVGGTVVDHKVIFGTALKAHASAFVIGHNHPSGRLEPSPADINFTKNLKEAGTILDIKLIDHLIITSEGYYSFADEGQL